MAYFIPGYLYVNWFDQSSGHYQSWPIHMVKKGSPWVLKQKGEYHAGKQVWMNSRAMEPDGEVALTGFFPSPVSIVPKSASEGSRWANSSGTQWDVKTPLHWWLPPATSPCRDLAGTMLPRPGAGPFIYDTESPATEIPGPFCPNNRLQK